MKETCRILDEIKQSVLLTNDEDPEVTENLANETEIQNWLSTSLVCL
jgi:hypothetical protein